MNAFWLDADPARAAGYHCDEHVVKMTTEYSQVLGESLAVNGSPELAVNRSYPNHPVVEWAAESLANWSELRRLADEVYRVKVERFAGGHKSYEQAVEPLPDEPDCLPRVGPTDKPICTKDYDVPEDDVVGAYREFYRLDKDFATYAHSPEPGWL